MKNLSVFVKNDIKPAYGCTEPGAIAYACAKARDIVGGRVLRVEMHLNSGIFKNALTCPVPGTDDMGKDFAAALGAVGGDSSRGLSAIQNITEGDIEAAHKLLGNGGVKCLLNGVDSRIYIQATVTTENGIGEVIIRDSHTNITQMSKDGKVVFEAPVTKGDSGCCVGGESINQSSFYEIYDYAINGPIEDMMFLKEALEMDKALLNEGLDNDACPMTRVLIKQNGGVRASGDWQQNAVIAACGTIEARLTGTGKPAMSLTGSGSHGILAMMPSYAIGKTLGKSEEDIIRCVMLSCLVTMYIKSYSGKLSAMCGCAVAGGTGSAVAICHMLGGDFSQLCRTVDNMGASVVGMICHGGNPGCVMKALAGIQSAIKAAEFALENVSIAPCHAILGDSPEKTMKNMGYISSPGMQATEGYILDTMKSK